MLKIIQPQLSIVICTYNRFTLLQEAIESLINQTANERTYEIIIIDNGNHPKIKKIVLNYQKKYPFPKINYFHQERTGLSFSRNLGVRKARGNYVGFLDDDAKADPGWVEAALVIFQKKAFVGIIGGPIYPLYHDRKPVWFKDEYEIRSWGKQDRNLNKNETFSGSNIIIKKEIFTRFGLFDERFGMSGGNLSLGEETSFFLKIWHNTSKNNLFYYSPRLVVYHLVDKAKMTVSYQLKRSFVAGQVRFFITRTPDLIFRLLMIAKYTIGILLVSFYSVFKIINAKYWQRWVVEEITPVFFALGVVTAALNYRIKVKR